MKELTTTWRNDCIVHKYMYRLTFLTFSLKPLFSVHLRLFDRITKVTETTVYFLKSFMASVSTLVVQLQRSAKGSVTHKPVVGCEHLKLNNSKAGLFVLFLLHSRFYMYSCKKCPGSYFTFLLPKRPWGTESSTTKSLVWWHHRWLH